MKHRIAWSTLIAVGGIFAVLLTGCEEKKTVAEPQVELPALPAILEGTVAQHARMLDAGYMPVAGYGLVVGLGDQGSREVPPRLRTRMTEYLGKQGLGWYRYKTEDLSPMMVLQDPDTAIVRVTGKIPAGAPKGTVFDVEIRALGSDVTSLDGGALMPVELNRERPGVDVATTHLQVWAEAMGPIYINPFIDAEDPTNQSKLLSGRIVGGGKVTKSSDVYLQMFGAGDYAWASNIEDAINKRFGMAGRSKVARAQDASLIQINVPYPHRKHYRDFLALVQYLPLRQDRERYAKQLAEALVEAPESEALTISLLLQGLGKRSVAFIRPLYTHASDRVAFYAARTGLRLGDVDQAGMVLGAMAERKDCEFRYEAITELGRHGEVYSQLGTLRRQLSDPDAEVRILAYRALLEHNDGARITRHTLLDDIPLDIVESTGPHTIFAFSTQDPRIVVFSSNIKLSQDIFLEMPNELLIVNARPGFERVKAWRKVPRKDTYTDMNTSSRELHDFILMIGTSPKQQSMVVEHVNSETGEVVSERVFEHRGLGLTYSQVIGVLQRMCAARQISARFVLR